MKSKSKEDALIGVFLASCVGFGFWMESVGAAVWWFGTVLFGCEAAAELIGKWKAQ